MMKKNDFPLRLFTTVKWMQHSKKRDTVRLFAVFMPIRPPISHLFWILTERK
jgi:hypothetical protein